MASCMLVCMLVCKSNDEEGVAVVGSGAPVASETDVEVAASSSSAAAGAETAALGASAAKCGRRRSGGRAG